MSNVNFNAAAELFAARHRRYSTGPLGYKRFDSAAEAVRFARRNSHQSVSWAPISKLTRPDSMPPQSAGSTQASPIP